MRVAFTSDLHVDSSAANKEALFEVARLVGEMQPDCVVVAGDVSADPVELARALEVFRSIDVPRIFVPGNHDVWLRPVADFAPAGDSTRKYDRLIARRIRDAGFMAAWRSVAVVGETAFVGTMGWYDYSFAPEYLALSKKDYQRREYEGLSWQDRHFAHWKPRGGERPGERLDDAEVTELLNGDFQRLLARASARRATSRIVAVTHHLPFREMVQYRNSPRWDYFCAFMGNRRMGELLQSFEKVTHVLAGHTHRHVDVRVGRLRCVVSPLGYLGRKRGGLADAIRKAVSLVELDEP